MATQIRNLKLSELEFNEGQFYGLPKNPRWIRDARFEALKKSIEDAPEMLELRELLIYPLSDLEGHEDKFIVIGGNMRLRACKELGYTEVPCKVLPLETPVKKLREYAIKDNEAFGQNDFDVLANEWDMEELQDFGMELDYLNVGSSDYDSQIDISARADDDNFDESKIVVDGKCKKGDIWILGNHRLMCADSLNAQDVALLMDSNIADIAFSSPPYNAGFGMNLTKDNGRSKYTNGNNDDLSEGDYESFLNNYIDNANRFSKYNFVNIQMLANNKIPLLNCLYKHKDRLADIIIWDKTRSQPAAAANVLNSEFKFVFCFSEKANRSIGTIPFHGNLKNIVHISPGHNDYSEVHNAVFPMELASYFISSFASNSVLELFGGTGTTLIAAEQLGRKCFAMEICPHYCDLIIARWEKLTGNKAILSNN